MIDGKRVVGSLSAPRTLLAKLWSGVQGLEHRLFAVTGEGYTVGDWDLLRRTLTCDDDHPQAHGDWMALAAAVREAGDRREAQLVWLQASDFGLASTRSAAFKAMFPGLPKSARVTSASSCAAFLERMLTFAGAPEVVDRFVAVRAYLDNLVEALLDVEGQRKARFSRCLETALKQLEDDEEPSIRELARLLRTQWGILKR